MIQTAANLCPPAEAEKRALVNRDIVCFSHDWTGDPLSRTHLMRLLARENRVLWVNSIGYRAPTVSKRDLSRAFKKLASAATPIKEVEKNLFVLNPLALPVYGRPWARAFNQRFLAWQVRRAMKKLDFREPINWTSNPAAAVVAGKLREHSLVYHCVDENTAFSGVARDSLARLEQTLLQSADLVLVSSQRLFDAKGLMHRHTRLIRHGVDFSRFATALDTETTVPEDIGGLPRPVIGYFGLMSADWIDVELLERIATHFHDGSLVLLGKVAMDLSAVTQRKNVHLLGRKPYKDLPAYCKGFDVGIIPFPISELTLNSNPLKAREYLAAGLPVVSTAIPEVAALPACRVADDHDEFIQGIEEALVEPGPTSWRSELMRPHSWDARLHEIDAHFAAAIQRRTTARQTATAE